MFVLIKNILKLVIVFLMKINQQIVFLIRYILFQVPNVDEDFFETDMYNITEIRTIINTGLPADLHWTIATVVIIGFFCLTLATARLFCAVGPGKLMCVLRPTSNINTAANTAAEDRVTNELAHQERLM